MPNQRSDQEKLALQHLRMACESHLRVALDNFAPLEVLEMLLYSLKHFDFFNKPVFFLSMKHSVVIDSGPRYEVAFPSGVSHFLEKLAFHVSN